MSENDNKSVIMVVMLIGGALLLLCCIGGAGVFFVAARKSQAQAIQRELLAKERAMLLAEKQAKWIEMQMIAAEEARAAGKAAAKEGLSGEDIWAWRMSEGKTSVTLESPFAESRKVTLSSVEAKVVGGTESISVKAVRQDTEQRVQFTFELGAIPEQAKAVELVCKLAVKSGDKTVIRTYKSSHSFITASENPEALPEKDD